MTTDIDYALLAGASYVSTRPDINKFPVPLTWNQVSYSPPKSSGFEAAAFCNGTTIATSTEIVVSFAGTYDKPLNPFTNPDLQADIALANGILSDQLRQAADYYLTIKASVPVGTTITFTGHSLGGGLASLMAVMFGESAVTFDQAPFLNSARTFVSTDFETGQSTTRSVAQGLHTYLGSRAPAALDAYIAANDPFNAAPIIANTLAARSGLVRNVSVEGEFLSVAPMTLFGRIGTNIPIRNTTQGVSGTDLHAQSLLVAYLQSEKTAEQGKRLNEVTSKLTDLLPMIFDKNLYARDTDSDRANFLERLVRHEAGVRDPATGATSIALDAMGTRFTRDLWKIAQDNGLTLTNNFVTKALTAFAMQMYYEDTDNAKNANKELFTKVTGGLQFDMADVAVKFKTEFDQGKALDLSDAKGGVHVRNYIYTYFTAEEQVLINTVLPTQRDWYIQAGAAGMTATDSLNRKAFLLGGAGSDGLVGGTGADLLIGNGGADLLQGKEGNDFLLGGKGNDTYVYSTGDGLDTILDSGDQNTLAVDGDILSGGAQYGDSRVHRSSDGKHLYVETSGRMLIDGNLIIQNYATGGNFGLTLAGPVAEPSLVTLSGTGADNFIGSNIYYRNPTDSNLSQATLSDGTTKVSELIGSGANNILEGKAGSDILSGGGGDDRLYADSKISVADAIAQGNAQSGSDLKGDWLAGGAGDDTLIGGADNDVLSGGGGSDLLIGGTGDDDILGDTDYVATSFTWNVTDQGDFRVFGPVRETLAPVGSAADVIYAGEGKDYVWAGAGNDVVFGEGGNDRLNGNEGNDILLGGAGSDTLWGGIGHDYLEGGAEADRLQGDDGDDILIGGGGNDTIIGGKGRDTYIYNKGDGIDEIRDDDTGPEKSILVFGEGVDKDAIKLRTGSLLLDMGNGDAIHIDNWDQENPLSNQSFASFQFADGTSLTWEELLQRGFDLDGTEGADTLIGTGVQDRLDGRAGDDLIYGLAGNDILTGGTGTDGLSGGAGDDTYLFNLGDSLLNALGVIEAISDQQGVNTVQFGAGITTAGINSQLDASGRYLVLNYGPGDTLGVEDGAAGAVANYIFADGQRLSATELIGQTATATLTGTALNGTKFALGGKAGDVIIANSGNTQFSGGRGDDAIYGSGGGNTYLYSAGDGADVINESAPPQDAPNRIRFGAGIASDDLVFARRADGALHIGFMDTTEGITLPGWFADNGQVTRRVQQLVFDDGSVYDTTALDDLPIAPIEGTPGNDSLIGTDGDDVIMGYGGDDVLDGGEYGDDTLMGGSGDDSYVFGWTTTGDWNQNQTDTIIEAAGETSTLRLQRGMSLDLFRGERQNNDLRFRVRGEEHSVVIKDYFDGDQQWQIQSYDGSLTSMDDFLARPDPASGDLLTQAWNDFASAARWEWGYDHETIGNWELLPDGSYHQSIGHVSARPSLAVSTSRTTGVWTDVDGSEHTLTPVVTYAVTSYPDNGAYAQVSDSYSRFGAPRVTLEDTAKQIFNQLRGVTDSEAANPATLQVQWTQPSYRLSWSTGEGSWVGYHYRTDANGALVLDEEGQPIRDGLIVRSGSQTYYAANANGTTTFVSNDVPTGTPQMSDVQDALLRATSAAIQAGGSGGSLDLTLPTTVVGRHVVTTYTESLQVHQGNSDNELLFMQTFLAIDGGGGDDTIISNDARNGLAFGGDGNDRIIGAEFASDVFNGGNGDDYLGGMGGDDTYLVVRGQTGHDVIDEVVGHYSILTPGSSWVWTAAGDAGSNSNDTVRFGEGITLDDLRFSYGVINSRMVDTTSAAAFYETLNISWARGESIHVLLPNLGNRATSSAMMANSGSSYGIEQFRFADGSQISMDEIQRRARDPAYQAPPDFGVPKFLSGNIPQATGTEGDDWLYGSYGAANYIEGLGGNDHIYGNNLGDYLSGDEGDDYLEGGLGSDILSGGGGNDTLIGAGSDVLIGGTGNDRLIATGGGNTFVYDLGDGADVIVDTSKANGATTPNILVFGNGISSGNITLDLGSLLIRVNGEEAIHIEGFDPQQPFAAPAIDQFVFADGSSLTYNDLLRRGFDISGTDNDETTCGTAVADRITGRAGNDLLTGGAGDDRYIYRLGDGSDRIVDSQGNDTLVIDAGMSKDGFESDRIGNDLIINLAGTGDFITLDNWYAQDQGIGRIEFGDGSFLVRSEFGAESNLPPIANADSITVHEDGGALNFAATDLLTNDTDPNPGDVLSVIGVGSSQVGAAVTLADGHVTYDIGSNFQALAAGETVHDSFRYAITDSKGAQASSLVNVDIAGTNDAPITAADAAATVEDTPLPVTGNVLGNDSDVDHGTVLRIAAPGDYVGAYGTLSLAADGGYAYALANDSLAVQSLAGGSSAIDHFTYAATDGLVATDSSLDITVHGANDAPITVNDAAIVVEDWLTAATGNVLANDRDVDAGAVLQVADPGTYAGAYGSLTLGADGRYTYTLDNAAVKVQSLGREAAVVEHFGYTTTDGQVGTGATLDVFLHGTNDAPIVVKPLADQDVTFNKPFYWQMPADSFKDIDTGDVPSYTATLADGSVLPDWLHFDTQTLAFSGVSPKAVTSMEVRVTATDKVAATGSTMDSLSASDVFTLSISHGNEGVGNGMDAAPAGQATNFNDGAGASPGNPGTMSSQTTLTLTSGASLASPSVAPMVPPTTPLALAAGTAFASSVSGSDTSVVGSMQPQTTPSVPIYLGLKDWEQYGPAATPSTGTSDAASIFARWLAMDLAVSQALADQPTAWADHGAGADVSVLNPAASGFLGSTTAFGTDAFSLLAPSSQNLQNFNGLAEGVQKIA